MNDNPPKVQRVAFTQQQSLILNLENLLDLARKGEVVGVMAVALKPDADGGVVTGWAGEVPAFAALGALRVLEMDFIRHSVEFDE